MYMKSLFDWLAKVIVECPWWRGPYDFFIRQNFAPNGNASFLWSFLLSASLQWQF